MFLSFVIPVHNEAGNVKKLHQELLTTARKINQPFEIIFVDDASTDETSQRLKQLKPVTIITFRTNYGQTAALDAGIHHANGQYVVTLDGDLQNDPADVPKMLEKLKTEDLDVVCGWRKKRKDNLSKRFISYGAKLLRKKLVDDGVHDSGCTLRVYKKECFEHLHLKGEMHRFIPAILKWRGFKIGEIKVNHRFRKYGQSKYTLTRTIKGFLDMLNIWFWRKYESRPLHMFGGLGILLMLLSTLLSLYLAYRRIFTTFSLSNKVWPLVSVTGFSLGLQLLVLGLLANLIIENRPKNKNFYQIKSIDQKI